MTNNNKIIIEGAEYTVEEWDAICRELLNPTPTPINSPKATSQKDFWRIENVNYRGKKINCRLSKKLIPPMNHDALVNYSLEAKAKGEFYAPNSILIFSIFESLYNSKNSNSEEARIFIQKSLRNNYPNTLTRIIYNPKNQLDEIIHNYGIPSEQFSFNKNVVGPDREINDSDKNILEKLVGTNDVKKIKEIFKWINSTPTYIYRMNSKPKNKDERVVRLYAVSVRANLYCNWDPSDVYPAFGVFEE